ncbi:hypothetical protein A2865_02625 [Candidatus Woesebacteria bacterium RIFCSPHIGHO2_01_FULL_39_17]|uniref:DNA primase/polymerase bifunctional N-terminal domain-containing protein n=3 Tax=Candidatus Woeseibacteriota TaxID=1752722 RepID=A0A0G0NCN1_9BACT|nr:MAG: hypothetical protein US72_C0003G0102 [Microgenomates group bacterium GW2011_GWC1_38_12]KKQ94527.1 MAG: hypothetical protein UT19_C0001G0059 [Candidatus Woesebacteria bacterium GW2011_GWB1_39_10b]KKR13924.1 MAG: hypothetical protein UT40_C0008G0048 [Candidatus Woesebacteria bacterium GW2011_GWA1_39_21b]OGM22485.1 MAG: hypothetical protein A2865_02625 [Candidatus Woesebacteria bacterium RIFCSPHIGHO2_01_FULL_39_17]OGM65532.1 MAG: hypothetical protein A3A52_01480 [Candidatus Woesebacteria b
MTTSNTNTNQILEQALLLSEKLKWSIVCVGKGEKIPLVPWKELQTRRATRKEIINWFTSYPEANVGIVLGKVSNLMVVDIDPRNGGSYEEFKDVKTVKVKTGGGGWHIYFQYDEGFHNLSSIRSGIDIKTEKGYAVAPPSIHQSGDLYKWISNPFDTQIIPIPDSIKEWLLNGKQEIKQNDKSTKIEEIVRGVCAGQRNTSAASLTGKLLRSLEEKEWESIAWPLIKSWNKENNNPPSPEEELRTTFESIKKKEWQRVEEEEQKGSFTKQLIEKILSSGAILFKDEYGDGYISPDGTGREIMKLRSRSFKLLVSRCSWQNFDGQPVHTDVISNITQMLEAKALFEGEQYNLFVRIARTDEAVWYDLGNGPAVKINKNGWEVVYSPPILFKRFSHQQPQIIPQRGGSVTQLDKFLNISNESERLLFKAFTISAFIPNFPHPLLVIHGPQGSGKTTPLKLLKSLIDPSGLKTMSEPDNKREFVQLASHHSFIFLDNLSMLQGWLSDSLARASTGDGLSKRELYSDDEDIIYSLQRTVALNGINLVVSKADLLDRSILIGLERISEKDRRLEEEYWAEFEREKPYILGAIFDCVSEALQEYPNINLSSLPRMADFTKWSCAITKGLGLPESDFLQAYYQKIGQQNDEALQASPVAQTILELMSDRDEWQGTPTELYEELNRLASRLKIDTNSRYWPKDPQWLYKRVQLVHSNLMAENIRVTRDEKSRPRIILIERVKNTDASDGVSEQAANTPENMSPDNQPKANTDGVTVEEVMRIFSQPSVESTPTLFPKNQEGVNEESY